MKPSLVLPFVLLFPIASHAAVWVIQPTVRFEMLYRSPTGQAIASSATGGVFIDDEGIRQTAGYSMSSSTVCCTPYGGWQVSYGIANTGSAPFEFVNAAEFPQFGVVLPGQGKSFSGVASSAFTGGMGASFSVAWDGLSAPGAMIAAAGLIPESGTVALLSVGLALLSGYLLRKRPETPCLRTMVT